MSTMDTKKLFHNIRCFLIIGCFTAMMSSGMMTSVHAAEYEIVFKTGAHGTIQGEKSVSYRKANGEVFPDEPNVMAEAGYAFDGWNKELPAVGSSVNGKEVYVARYITLVDGVEYRVRYVDTNGIDIATQKVSVTENGHTVQERAKVLAGYTYDEAEKALQISPDSHEIVFVYTLVNEEAAATNPPVQTISPEDQTGNPTNPDANTPNVTPDGNPDTNPDVEQVEDNTTPQGGGEENVDDNTTPLASLDNDHMIWIYGTGGIVLIGAILLALAWKRRKKDQI